MISRKIKRVIVRFLETVTEKNPEGDWRKAIIDVYGWKEDCPWINQYFYAVRKQLESLTVVQKLVRATEGSTQYVSTKLKKKFLEILDEMDHEVVEELKDIASLYYGKEREKINELIENLSRITLNKIKEKH